MPLHQPNFIDTRTPRTWLSWDSLVWRTQWNEYGNRCSFTRWCIYRFEWWRMVQLPQVKSGCLWSVQFVTRISKTAYGSVWWWGKAGISVPCGYDCQRRRHMEHICSPTKLTPWSQNSIRGISLKRSRCLHNKVTHLTLKES